MCMLTDYYRRVFVLEFLFQFPRHFATVSRYVCRCPDGSRSQGNHVDEMAYDKLKRPCLYSSLVKYVDMKYYISVVMPLVVIFIHPVHI